MNLGFESRHVMRGLIETPPLTALEGSVDIGRF